MEYSNELLISAPDERDWNYKDIVGYGESLVPTPGEYTIPTKWVRDQLKTSTCYSQAMSSIREAIDDSEEPYSDGYLNACRTSSEGQGVGLSLRDICKIVCRTGVILKSKFPTMIDYPDIKSEFDKLPNKDELIELGTSKKSLGYVRVDLEDITTFLAQEQTPVLLGVRVHNDFYVYYKDGNAMLKERPEKYISRGYHAIGGFGYKYIGNLNYIDSLNSWGEDWGNKGHAYINPTDKALVEAWGLTDKRVIKPPTPGVTKLYRVQLGAFSVKDNALLLQKELSKGGIDSCLKYDGKYYRVQAGCFKVKVNAEEFSKKLQGLGFDTYIVITTE